MNQIKRVAGILWLLLSLGAAYYCIGVLGLPKFGTGKQEDLVFGIIILFVLTPIIVGGLFTFGLYAVQGEYDSDR
jgi:hypothetical protein